MASAEQMERISTLRKNPLLDKRLGLYVDDLLTPKRYHGRLTQEGVLSEVNANVLITFLEYEIRKVAVRKHNDLVTAEQPELIEGVV